MWSSDEFSNKPPPEDAPKLYFVDTEEQVELCKARDRIKELEEYVVKLESVIEEKENTIQELKANKAVVVDNSRVEPEACSSSVRADNWRNNPDHVPTVHSGQYPEHRSRRPKSYAYDDSPRRYRSSVSSRRESRDVLDIVGDAGGWPDDVADFLGV